MIWPWKTAEETATASATAEPVIVPPVQPVIAPPPFAADYVRQPCVIPPKAVHVPKPVEIFPDRTGTYTVNGISTHRQDN